VLTRLARTVVTSGGSGGAFVGPLGGERTGAQFVDLVAGE
jgi:hypothetical protein